MNLKLVPNLVFILLVLDSTAATSAVLPRWGQATALIYDTLFVQGGFTDEFNEYSYTSAPINGDLLYLSLSTSFDPSSPPWQLINSSTDSSTSSGPAVAWHTIPALNTTDILLFGGRPAVDSPTVLTVQADSAWLLNIFNSPGPQWFHQPTSWANEPIRRIHHTTVTSRDGLVFLVGGEKADGSGNTFSDHYVFDSNTSNFTQLPTNGPPGITGHASVILSNGTLLVFGGYDQLSSSLVSLSTIWSLDTTASSFSWTTLTIPGSLPSPRRAFAAVVIEGVKILIQGGCDSVFQDTYSDGWILDMAASSPSWSQITALSQVGQRRDHFAVAYGSEVIFGFGYGSSGPVSADLQIYDLSVGSFLTSYAAPSPTSPVTQTIPGPTQTSYPSWGQSGSPSDPTGTNGIHPTGTNVPSNPTSTSGGNGGGSPADSNDGSDHTNTTAVAVGTVFGVLGLLACAIVVVYVMRRRRDTNQGSRFMILNEDDPDARILPVHPVGENAYSTRGPFRNLSVGVSDALTALPVGIIGLTRARRAPQRRDMLADEDTRDFGPWYDRRRTDGTGGSSWSLMSIIRLRSREPSTGSSFKAGAPWREKGEVFSDGAALIQDEETGYVGATVSGQGSARPSHTRDMSYGSSWSGSSNYRDPFSDPFNEAQDEDLPIVYTGGRSYPQVTPLQVQTILPISMEVHTLSPVTEASRGTLTQSDKTDHSGSVSSHSHDLSPFDNLSGTTSQTSQGPRPSSLFDANARPMARSDSWWSRFSRTAFLDRRASVSRQTGGMPEIRDPNPPPRLVAIEESQHSASPEDESPKSNRSDDLQRALSKRGSKVFRSPHGKSLSSLQTADSETIERMAGMDVAQRERTGSHNTRDGTGTSYEDSVDMWLLEDGRGSIAGADHNADIPPFNVISPTEMTPAETSASSIARTASSIARTSISNKDSPPTVPPPVALTPLAASTSNAPVKTDANLDNVRATRPLSGSSVAARILDYERRMSEEQIVPAPTNTKHREERSRKKSTVHYGLVPRASLYVANPDHQSKPSDDS